MTTITYRLIHQNFSDTKQVNFRPKTFQDLIEQCTQTFRVNFADPKYSNNIYDFCMIVDNKVYPLRDLEMDLNQYYQPFQDVVVTINVKPKTQGHQTMNDPISTNKPWAKSIMLKNKNEDDSVLDVINNVNKKIDFASEF